MSNAVHLRVLAEKCEELALVAPSDDVRKRQIELAASYRRLADREEWIDAHPLPLPKAVMATT